MLCASASLVERRLATTSRSSLCEVPGGPSMVMSMPLGSTRETHRFLDPRPLAPRGVPEFLHRIGSENSDTPDPGRVYPQTFSMSEPSSDIVVMKFGGT